MFSNSTTIEEYIEFLNKNVSNETLVNATYDECVKYTYEILDDDTEVFLVPLESEHSLFVSSNKGKIYVFSKQLGVIRDIIMNDVSYPLPTPENKWHVFSVLDEDVITKIFEKIALSTGLKLDGLEHRLEKLTDEQTVEHLKDFINSDNSDSLKLIDTQADVNTANFTVMWEDKNSVYRFEHGTYNLMAIMITDGYDVGAVHEYSGQGVHLSDALSNFEKALLETKLSYLFFANLLNMAVGK